MSNQPLRCRPECQAGCGAAVKIKPAQEALSRKADKSYTKRKMAILVTRVSALLKDDADEPTLAKQKCLSCDRAFNKTSFRDLELAYRVSALVTMALI